MCGIAGIVGRDAPAAYREHVGRMVSSLRHRGPDGCGLDVLGDAVLGHTRLSIVDLSSGDQPMRDGSGKRSIVFNGEIYGFREIRSQLRYSFRTTSDTEVILALYDAYGTDMLRHLPGMFAFALWDDVNGMLFAARDRFGEKPLYYAQTETGALVFGSEIKAILASELVRPKLSRRSLAHYLNRLYVPVGSSIYETIEQLRPGHALTFKDGILRVWRYWDAPKVEDRVTLGDAVEEFRRLFAQAVNRQLVADVEVGAFLSGGLDSSTVVSTASELSPRLRTFSFGFSDGPSEIAYARDVAALCGVENVELHDSQNNVAELAVKMASIYDEPFGDSSAVPTYMISRLAAKHLKVVLTGDGGDELLGGYPWYPKIRQHGVFERNPAWLNTSLFFVLRVARRAVPGLDPRLAPRLRILKRQLAGQTPADTHRRLRDFVAPEELRASGLALELMESERAPDAADAAMRTDIADYMAGDILVKTDRAAMASSLELRAPFLDVDFASFCLGVPSRLKLDGRSDKILLRHAAGQRWPPSVRSRGKQGFAAPVSAWFARPEFSELKRAYLDSGPARDTVVGLLGATLFDTLAREENDRTWALLMLSVWMQQRSVEC
jgi:asparagine synthase (glutamine-hydrolysing)